MEPAQQALSDKRVVNAALFELEELSLPHPAVALLRLFILEAVDKYTAAEYVRSKIFSAEEAYQLASDWAYVVEAVSRNGTTPQPPDVAVSRCISQRDGQVCCVSGLRGTFWDPLIVSPVLAIPVDWIRQQDRVLPMLTAFFGAPYLNWWLDYINEPNSMTPEQNHWLVRRSVAQALRSGRVKLDRAQPSMTEFMVDSVIIDTKKPIQMKGFLALLGDHSRAGIRKVDPRLIGTHARFSKSIQIINLARETAPGLSNPLLPLHYVSHTPTQVPLKPWPGRFQLTSILTTPLFRMWLLFPRRLRRLAYEGLRQLGAYLYGVTAGHASVQKLPFGLFLKYGGTFEWAENEFNALRTVRRHTTLTVPKALDLVSEVVNYTNDWGYPDRGPKTYLLMTELPGAPLSQCINAISDDNYQLLARQLQDAVSQLRQIPSVNPALPICNTLGAACREPRIRDWAPLGPFADEAAFSQNLRFPDDPARRGHRIVFTHADLNPRNIMVDQRKTPDGRLEWAVVGIIDWETAGYYPEYWDCTKSLFEGFRWPKRHNDVMKSVFAAMGDYTAEMDVERRAWESGDGV
ncbi:kinase-like domain [Cordyceps militaris]|uniref:Kinase-like domain n=1 Tax=Cordyceps militaris TaxID=73501 RepID=A0A2H4SFJ7_CORMI|nr:kinase-like domain [Cordyceps militaris]